MDLDEFRRLADRAVPRLNAQMSGVEMAEVLGRERIDRGPVGLAKFLQEDARAAFSSGHWNVSRLAGELCRELVFDHEVNGAALDPYMDMLNFLREWSTGIYVDEPIEGDWEAAVQAARDNWAVKADALRGSVNHPHTEVVWQAASAKRLHAIGRSNPRVPVERFLSPARHDAVVRHIEKLAMHLGGQKIAECLFRELRHLYDDEQERYHFVNRFLGPAHTAPGPRMPANYMLQLAAKFAVPKRPLATGAKAWVAFKQACIDYAVDFNVQPTSNLRLMHRTLPQFHSSMLVRLAVHDSLFSLEQIRASDVPRIGRGLLKSLVARGVVKTSVQAESQDGLAFIEGVLAATKGRFGPLVMSTAEIERAVPQLPAMRVRELLNQRFSHQLSAGQTSANARFRHPADIPNNRPESGELSGADFCDKPFIQIGQDRYLLLDRAACSSNLIRVFMDHIRPSLKSDDLGKAIEAYVRHELSSKLLDPLFGKYEVSKGVEYDCDAVLQDDKAVIFFEVKAKVLTAAARAGLDIAALVDIAQSLVAATVQSGRHERYLRERRRLALKTEQGDEFEVALESGDKEQDVVRIALSLSDFGAFQDNVTPETLLAHHVETTFELSEEAPQERAIVDRVKEVNKETSKLKQLNTVLFQQAEEPERWLGYRHCHFLSVPQLLIILDEVSSVRDVAQEIRQIRSTIWGSQDLYFEIHSRRKLRADVAAERARM